MVIKDKYSKHTYMHQLLEFYREIRERIIDCVIIKQAGMGIDGLLNLLRPVTQKQHISTFKDQRIAVDAMPWIYKGCYSCAMQLNQNIQSIDFLYYILQMLDMLSYYNIKPIFVFDGRAVKAKSETLEKRKKSKEENKLRGLEFLKNNQLQQARKFLSRCIIIDQRIISLTISALVTKNVDFIVAPYQADCQIAKLKHLNLIDAVISEDSDLIAFGVNVILKLNQNGQCDYVDLRRWRPRDVEDVFLKYFLAFDEMNRVDAAILAGSDYNQSVKGIGIKRAIKLLTTQATMKNVINTLKFKKTYMQRIPQNYQQTVQRSKLIFSLSTVYNPLTSKLQYLRPQLLNQLKPPQMTEQELREIVGLHYEYDDDVAHGRVASKTLERREIKMLNFPQIFRINKENMMAHEVMLKKRKFDQQQLKKQQQQYIQQLNGQLSSTITHNDQLIYQQLNEFKKRAGRQQTHQQIQKRKQERKNRINKLHELMSSLCDIFGDSEDEEDVFGSSDGEEEVKKTAETIDVRHVNEGNGKSASQKKVTQVTTYQSRLLQNHNKKGAGQEAEKYITSEQQSVDEDLGFLNPFIKKNINTTSSKK